MGNMCFRMKNKYDNIERVKEKDLMDIKNKNSNKNYNVINYIIVDDMYRNTIDKNDFINIINKDFISIIHEQEGKHMINEIFFMMHK